MQILGYSPFGVSWNSSSTKQVKNYPKSNINFKSYHPPFDKEEALSILTRLVCKKQPWTIEDKIKSLKCVLVLGDNILLHMKPEATGPEGRHELLAAITNVRKAIAEVNRVKEDIARLNSVTRRPKRPNK